MAQRPALGLGGRPENESPQSAQSTHQKKPVFSARSAGSAVRALPNWPSAVTRFGFGGICRSDNCPGKAHVGRKRPSREQPGTRSGSRRGGMGRSANDNSRTRARSRDSDHAPRPPACAAPSWRGFWEIQSRRDAEGAERPRRAETQRERGRTRERQAGRGQASRFRRESSSPCTVSAGA